MLLRDFPKTWISRSTTEALTALLIHLLNGVSNTRLKKFSENLKSFVRDHAYDVVAPHIQKTRAAELDAYADAFRLELSENGEQVRLYYPTVLGSSGDYIGNSVLIEFGGRNIIEPNVEHNIEPDIVSLVPSLAFPRSTVSVLSPARTFWEKATLMHVECQRNEFRASAERLSRHWYDLALLADCAHGQIAVGDHALLEDVVKHKKVFYNASYANYDACLIGQIRLIPENSVLSALRDDYQRMIRARMFIGEPPTFDAIIERLRVLEATINVRLDG